MGEHDAPEGAPAGPIVAGALAHRPPRPADDAVVEGPVGWPGSPTPEGGGLGWPVDLDDVGAL